MSTATLTSCFTFNPSAKPSYVELESIKLPEEVSAPEGSLVTLYGFRDALEELSALRHEADAHGLQFCSVAIEMDAGSVPSSINLSQLPDARFVNLRRVARDIENIVISKFRKYYEEEGRDPKSLETRHFEYLLQRPDLISRLREEDEFAHVEAFAFPVNAGKTTNQRVALFSMDHVLSVKPKNYPEIEVALPKTLKQKSRLGM